jgi:6-phosphogluconolactonase
MKQTALYASVGPLLTHYEIDVQGMALVKRETLKLANNVQYAWPHASKPYLYVASSSRIDRNAMGTEHYLSALRIDPKTGALAVHGAAARLPHRPVHVSTDHASRNVLVAFNNPAGVQVYRINDDGSVGDLLGQRGGIDNGVFPHQVRTTPDDELAILVTRGNPFRGHHAHLTDQTDAGALKIFEYNNGTLGAEVSVAPGGGIRFGPRHIDFHPRAPWVFVSLETQNKLYVFKREGKRVLPEPVFERDLLKDPQNTPNHQGAGTIHVHPNGRFVYCVNRGHAPTDYQGKKVLIGADNTFVVYAINEATGEPTEICPRTFALHPGGKMLVAANCESHWVKDGNDVRMVSGNLAVFEVKDDGTLKFVRKYDVDLGPGDKLFWAGMVDY